MRFANQTMSEINSWTLLEKLRLIDKRSISWLTSFDWFTASRKRKKNYRWKNRQQHYYDVLVLATSIHSHIHSINKFVNLIWVYGWMVVAAVVVVVDGGGGSGVAANIYWINLKNEDNWISMYFPFSMCDTSFFPIVNSSHELSATDTLYCIVLCCAWVCLCVYSVQISNLFWIDNLYNKLHT